MRHHESGEPSQETDGPRREPDSEFERSVGRIVQGDEWRAAVGI